MPECTLIMATVPGRELLLERALASAAGQGFAAIEVELDAAGEGPAAVRNRALERVRTPLVAVMDDDDVLLPGHLAVLAGALERAGGTVLAHPACVLREEVDGEDLPLPDWWVQRWARPFREGAAAGLLRRENWVPVTVVARTAALRSVGGYSLRRSDAEDWSMLLELVDRYGPGCAVGPGDGAGIGPGATWIYMVGGRSAMWEGARRPGGHVTSGSGGRSGRDDCS